MQTWMETDGEGRQFLVRTGTGVVTAVAVPPATPATVRPFNVPVGCVGSVRA